MLYSSDTTTLGVQWEPRTDRIHYARCRGGAKDDEKHYEECVHLCSQDPFDPIGLLSPFILQARLIMKECHLLGMKWSDTLPQELQPRWKRWVGQLQYLGNVHFARYVPLLVGSLIVIFSGASECGYGAVAYCHTFDEKEGKWVSNILCARSRIAPARKMLTIPKKELAGCLVAAELGQFLHEELEISKDRMRFFCDSEVCLFQLTKNPSYLQPFTANRVEKIQAWGFSFQYVNTCDNPADICSRGCDALHLNSEFWQHGPKWLSLPEEEWPTPKVDFTKIDRMEGMRKKHIFTFQTSISLTTPMQHPVNKPRTVGNSRLWPTTAELLQIGKKDRISFAKYYSEYRMLIKRTAWVFFVLRKWRSRLSCMKSDTPLILPSQIDRSKAEIYWIKISQHDSFASEIKSLQENSNLPLNSKIIGFSPFLDDQGIMRVGGRLAFSDLTQEQKNPIILAKEHFFTRMVVLDYHERHHHTGVDQTHFGLRERFWILQSRQLIRKILRTCVKCRHITSQPYAPLMGNLPEGRLSLSDTEPPWTHVGVDLTGAIQLRRVGRRTITPEKAYIVLYTCLATRGVYLDLMITNKTEDFLLSFKRLCGELGTPKYLYSDQAGYFVRANEELKESYENMESGLKSLQNNGQILWRFNASKAPHEAGTWERLVKSTKHILLKICRNALLNYVEFQTVLKETQALLNDRPLLQLSSDALDVLTPSMLIYGKRLLPYRDNFAQSNIKGQDSAKIRWEHRAHVMDHLYAVWRKEYRLSLQQKGEMVYCSAMH